MDILKEMLDIDNPETSKTMLSDIQLRISGIEKSMTFSALDDKSTELNLENNNLTGNILSSLGHLRNLQYLVIRNNKLGGEIPPSIPGIPTLIELDQPARI